MMSPLIQYLRLVVPTSEQFYNFIESHTLIKDIVFTCFLLGALIFFVSCSAHVYGSIKDSPKKWTKRWIKVGFSLIFLSVLYWAYMFLAKDYYYKPSPDHYDMPPTLPPHFIDPRSGTTTTPQVPVFDIH